MDSLNNKSNMSFCFNKDDFMMNTFSVDTFVSECRKYATLDTMKDDLGIYHKILCSAMIELINNDYADFVNLSTNLVGLDKSISNLTTPLQTFKDEVEKIKNDLQGTLDSVQSIFNERTDIYASKVYVQHLLCVLQCLEKIRSLNRIEGLEVTEQLENLERIAFSYNEVQYHLSKIPMNETIAVTTNEIHHITSLMQKQLESIFLQGFKNKNTLKLQRVLRIYSVINKEEAIQIYFSKSLVRPIMSQIISQASITKNGLAKALSDVIDWMPSFACDILAITRRSNSNGVIETVSGYDFLVNSIWPEVIFSLDNVSAIYLYSPGDPNLFHKNYTASMNFLEQFELSCGSQSSVERLRNHPMYKEFLQKWNLMVYFQVRFQEIAGEFEAALLDPFAKMDSPKWPYNLQIAIALWNSIISCWSDSVYLAPLKSSFFKLTFQLISRFSSCAISDLKHARDEIEITRIAFLIKDTECLITHLNRFFLDTVSKKLNLDLTSCNPKSVFMESVQKLEEIPKLASGIIVQVLLRNSLSHLKLITDIPRLYRKTNRDMPTKSSSYVTSVLGPLNEFLSATDNILPSRWIKHLKKEVTDGILKEYTVLVKDVLTSIKKMEDSLKILKRARDKPSVVVSTGTISDDDKIRHQLYIDVTSFEDSIVTFGFKTNEIASLKELKDLVVPKEKLKS